MAFEYRYSFSVDEEMLIPRSDWNWSGVECTFETKINFIVKGISGERITIGWESFTVSDPKSFTVSDPLSSDSEGYVRRRIGRRLSDCWMSNRQIRTMIQQFMAFANQIRYTGRWGFVPAAVDVEVCTAQREGETMAAAVDRAMKPEHLPPLYLYPVESIGHPAQPPMPQRPDYNITYLKAMGTIRVEDEEKAMSVMDLCAVCGRKPIVGTQILSLLCGHAFHYHCIAQRLLVETNSCPTCNHQPAFKERLSFGSTYKYDNAGRDSEEDDDDLCDGTFPFPNPFWSPTHYDNDNGNGGDESHSPTTAGELYWSRLLDNDAADDGSDRRLFDNDDDDDDDESDADYDPDQDDESDTDYDPDHDSDLD